MLKKFLFAFILFSLLISSASATFSFPAVTKKIVPNGVSRSPYIGAIALDAKTGNIYISDHANRPGYPASTTKLMTLLLVLEDIAAKKTTLSTITKASKRATLVEPSSIGIKVGESITIDNLLKALMVKSANDAAIILAEHCSGSVENFVNRMNERAKSLGMTSTRFTSPNGLPPSKREKRHFDISTAADLAKLGLAVSSIPKALEYTSLRYCKINYGEGKTATYRNHNKFISNKYYRSKYVDGLKTGYTNASGSSIVLTSLYKGKRSIIVVLGSSSAKLRDDSANKILQDVHKALNCWD